MKTCSFFIFSLFMASFLLAQELPKDRWKITYFSSEEVSGEGTNGRAHQIIDGSLSTYWHSRWVGGAAALPHEIQLDLGDSCLISGIKLWPRQNNCSGKPVQYEYYISKDGVNWGTPVALGTFKWAASNDNEAQTVTFAQTKGRYIRFRQLSTYACGSGGIGCISEMSVQGTYTKLYAAGVLQLPAGFVAPKSIDKVVLPLLVEVYDTIPLTLQRINFSTKGTTDLADVDNVKIYNTGSSPVFNTQSVFGTTTKMMSDMEIPGDMPLKSGSNYLWITYDLSATAKIGNYLDAELKSVTVSDSVIIPTVSSTTEKQMIMGVRLTDFPVDKQLYPRDRTTNHASVVIAGSVTDYNQSTTALNAVVYRGGVAIDTLSTTPQFKDGMANFSFTYKLKAELKNYDFQVFSVNDSHWNLVYTARDVVAGDAYVLTGQSNAVATIWWGETTTEMEHPFIRTYGSAVSTGDYTKEWFKAVSHNPSGSAENGMACDGQVGVLGLSIGRQLVDTYSVPIAILNGAHGGKEIAFFAKNQINPTDIKTNYGRLLTRLQESKLKENIESIIWFQGETDATMSTSQATYTASFTQLHSAWKHDFSNLKKIYVYQIKQGCGSNVDKVNAIQEAHRQLPTLFHDVQLMSTNPVAQQEGCHFPKAGYVTHATNMLRLIKKDFYNSIDTLGITAPNVVYAALTKTNEIALYTNCAEGLVWQNNVHNDFKLHNTTLLITSGRVEGSVVYLTTSAPFSTIQNVKLSYLGRGGGGTPAIVSKKGIGLLCFNQLSVQRLNQTISFEQLSDTTFVNSSILLQAMASSNLPVAYHSSDTAIASIKNDVLYFHSAGTVTVTASQLGNNLYQSAPEVSRIFSKNVATSILEQQQNYTRVYPNPVEKILTVRADSPIESIEIVTLSGRKVKYSFIDNNRVYEWNVDVSGLKPGLYLLQLKNIGQYKPSTVKFIKK